MAHSLLCGYGLIPRLTLGAVGCQGSWLLLASTSCMGLIGHLALLRCFSILSLIPQISLRCVFELSGVITAECRLHAAGMNGVSWRALVALGDNFEGCKTGEGDASEA